MKRNFSEEEINKYFAFAIIFICIDLVFFKFVPDIGTAVVQNTNPHETYLSSFSKFEGEYLAHNTVMSPRFLGTEIMYRLAKFIDLHIHSSDIRLHPLRIAAALVTPVYAFIGLYFVTFRKSRYDWKEFFSYFSLVTLIGLYVFYPGDMPSFAFLSVGLFFLLGDRLLAAFLLMLITGLFRETSFHLVIFVLLWGISNGKVKEFRRLTWVGLFIAGFLAEYLIIRHFFPGPVSMNENGFINLDPRNLFLGAGFASLTTICSLSLAAIFPIICVIRISKLENNEWRKKFFLMNCMIFPLWIVFYRAMGGNISEFRLLFPAILPCIYGISYKGVASIRDH
jgi:hypothetical protein